MATKAALLLFAVACPAAAKQCPGELFGTPISDDAEIPTLQDYNAALKGLNIQAVVADIVHMLTKTQSCWPADSSSTSAVGTSYGGLFTRLSWHCSGSYRNTDGRGGCSGGRQRFQPENSWDDNTNLDKARALLWPIKQKYGDALSWGDLFILAGTSSILHMGGPINEICVGRVDDANGSKSAPLGPGPEQPACPIQGDCKVPLGTSTVGLIFSRMGMNDTETVALIGGDHAFGRSHGACPSGAGPSPKDQPHEPWPGACGSGKATDTFTSGIEGPWTTDPFKWDNEYFTLLNTWGKNYTTAKGPGGKYQWRIPEKPDLMMMTTDVALVYDNVYAGIVKEYATDLPKLEAAFAAAWEKLTTSGGVWAQEKKCWTPDNTFKHSAL